jgi:hypothetical protein
MRTLLSLLVLLSVVGLAQGQGGRQLADFLPRDANVVVGVNVPKLLTSEAGQAQRLDAFLQMQVGEGRTTVSPTGEGVVMAANIDLASHQPTWQLFLWRNSQALSAKDLADKIKGQVDQVGEMDAVTKGNFLLVRLMPDAWGVLSPANRQVTGRWLRDSVANSPPMPIAQKLRTVAQNGAAIAIVIDLRDFFSAAQLSPRLSKSESIVVDAGLSGDEAAAILASVQWATATVTASSTFQGEITLDFARTTEKLKPIAMKLLTTTMSNRGLTFDDMSQWTATAVDTRVVGRGPISPAGVRKLLTLLDPPRPPLNDQPKDAIAGAGTNAGTSAGGSADSIGARSAAYFKQVNLLLNDLQNLRNADADSGIAYITRYIGRIEALSMVNIDPMLLDWSANVTATLSESVKALRESKIAGKSAALAATSTYDPLNVPVNYHSDDSYYHNWYDVYEDREAQRDRDEEMRRMRTKAASERVRAQVGAGYQGREAALQLLSNLDQESAQVRRAMVAKYNIDF